MGAMHGGGDVGLSAIMIARAVGANVVAAVTDITQGGAHVSLDALGHLTTCFNSINNLRKRGKHIQVRLMLAPEKLIGKTINLKQSIAALMNMDRFDGTGLTVVTEF